MFGLFSHLYGGVAHDVGECGTADASYEDEAADVHSWMGYLESSSVGAGAVDASLYVLQEADVRESGAADDYHF